MFNGEYTSSFNIPLVCVRTAVRDNNCCLAINNKPFGDLVSVNILAKRLTSVSESVTAFIPPRKIKSSLAPNPLKLSGIAFWIYGCPLLPPPMVSLPYLKDLRSVRRLINIFV